MKLKKLGVYILCFLLLLGCTLANKNNENLSDLESLQFKTSFVDLYEEEIDLSVFKEGKIVVSYWATWCGPCIKEMPGIIKAEEILKNHNYTFLLISDEKLSKISKFKNDTKYDFNFLKSLSSNETYGIYSLPTSYIFDEKGMKVETIVGKVVWDSEQMIKKLKALYK